MPAPGGELPAVTADALGPVDPASGVALATLAGRIVALVSARGGAYSPRTGDPVRMVWAV